MKKAKSIFGTKMFFANPRGVWGLPQQAILCNSAYAEFYKI